MYSYTRIFDTEQSGHVSERWLSECKHLLDVDRREFEHAITQR